MILTNVSDTIRADSLALFALNIEISLADVTKPEKLNIIQAAFESHGKTVEDKQILMTSGVTIDVTGQVKVEMFDISGLVTSAS